ncbi:bifunctional Protein kinase domain/Protein kinase [Babesia duncani]|uniref:non-specific serine/threonine protein kinase n=1 Tax=Babesia duncani TaxID=323732 RepID=A0AAD9PL55_9APIC|nr:bifunctional Protein kinase domain/Protein kinase [Babesia duncani]
MAIKEPSLDLHAYSSTTNSAESDVPIEDLLANQLKVYCSKGQSATVINEEYSEVRALGSGSFGRTTLMQNKQGHMIVRKKIDISRLTRAERNLCLNEVKIISSLGHPFIVSYFGSYMQDNNLCIITEYCKGGDMHQYIARKRRAGTVISEARIIRWTSQILSALCFMHKRHVLHRDLKSLNVLIDSDKRIRLCDFGVSKALGKTAGFADTMIGTPYYFSPELIKVCLKFPNRCMSQGQRYSWPSDIWALGCIVYELATFRTPFDGAKGMHHLFGMIKTRQVCWNNLNYR